MTGEELLQYKLVQMMQNLQIALLFGAIVTFIVAAAIRSSFLLSLVIGLVLFSGLTIALNGWPYFQVFFFGETATQHLERYLFPVAILLVGAVLGTGLQALWRRFRAQGH